MPFKSKVPAIKKTYSENQKSQEIIDSAVLAVKQILEMKDVLEKHKKEMLSDMIWKISEANGKWNTRYFSEGVLDDKDAKIHHEHVITRKEIITQLLENPKDYKNILLNVTACIVTTDEHDLLGMQNSVSGWDRYKKAGVKVYDRIKENWFN